MKRIILLLLILSFSLVGCCKPKKINKFTYNNQTYVTNFYDENVLFNCNEVDGFNGDPIGNSIIDFDNLVSFTYKDRSGYELKHELFQMLSLSHGLFSSYLYVLESEFTKAKEYYLDYHNYYYYVAFSDLSFTKVKGDIKKVTESLENEELLTSLNKYQSKEKVIAKEFFKEFLYFYKISKDGLFTTMRNQYILYNNHLYKFTGEDDKYTYGYILDSKLEAALLNLI